MERDLHGLKLGIFYSKTNPLSSSPNHTYTFELGTAKELEKSYWDKKSVPVGSIGLSRFSSKVRRALEHHYKKINDGSTESTCNPACGYISYKVFGDEKKRVAFATRYYPRLYLRTKQDRKARTKPGLGALFEYLSLSHLVPNEKVTHISVFDALKNEVVKTDDPKKITMLPINRGYSPTRDREAQLRSKKIDPEKVYSASSWMQKLKQKRLDSRRPTRFSTSKSRRSI